MLLVNNYTTQDFLNENQDKHSSYSENRALGLGENLIDPVFPISPLWLAVITPHYCNGPTLFFFFAMNYYLFIGNTQKGFNSTHTYLTYKNYIQNLQYSYVH